MRRAILAGLAMLWFGCGDDGGQPDAAADAAVDGGADATVDGAADGGGPCPDQLTFTGEYIDWDSSESSFLGIFEAELIEDGNESNRATTAPNGRGTLCLPRSAPSLVRFVHASYLPVRFTVAPPSSPVLPFSVRGVTATRLDELMTGWGLAVDDAAAQVEIEVQEHGTGDPLLGATVSLGNGAAGAFTQDETGDFVPGMALTDDRHVFFANVPLGNGTTTVTVVPPANFVCEGPATISLRAAEIAAATYQCYLVGP